MGTNLQRFHNTKVRRSSEQKSEGGLGAFVINFMKQGCLCSSATQKKGKRQLHHQDKKHSLLNDTGVQLVTLEEWILASPYLSVGNEGDQQFQVPKKASKTKRVHPSIARTQGGCLTNPRENFSMERSSSVKFDQVNGGDADDSSLCRSQSGKLKKKVSFKIPEVAEVFILHSPV